MKFLFAIILGYKHAFGDRYSYIIFRLKNQQNITRFKSELENINWPELPGYNYPYVVYRSFPEKYTAILTNIFL